MKTTVRGFLFAVVRVIGSWVSVEAQVRSGSVFPEPGSQVRGQEKGGRSEPRLSGSWACSR